MCIKEMSGGERVDVWKMTRKSIKSGANGVKTVWWEKMQNLKERR